MYGKELSENLIDNLDNEVSKILNLEEISPYTVAFPSGEILLIEGKYFVGDGFGNPIYSPTRASMENYQNGNARITTKIKVSKK